MKHPPRIAVMASTKTIAESVIRELGLSKAIALNPSPYAMRGMALSLLLVEESAWPLSSHTQQVALAALAAEHGYVMRLERHDPKEWSQ